MGIYINPKNKNKEQWLESNAISCGMQQINECDFKEHFPVCLVNNGAFSAAAVAPDKKEIEVFSNPTDYRPKEWYLVSLESLTTVLDEHEIKYITGS